MGEDDPVKVGVGAAAEALMKPFADLVQKIADPGAEELGLTVQDYVKVFRFQRRLRSLKRTQEIIRKSGVEPQTVPMKLLAPIFENATLEEDDELQDRWAALLANAATSDGVRVSYCEVLKQLTRDEVLLLRKQFYAQYPVGDSSLDPARSKQLVDIWVGENKKTGEDYATTNRRKLRCMNTLARLGLCHPLNFDVGSCHLTRFGYDFVEACELPEDLRQESQRKK